MRSLLLFSSLLSSLLAVSACGLVKVNSNIPGVPSTPGAGEASAASSSGGGGDSDSGEAPAAAPMAKGQGQVWCEGYTPQSSDSNATWARDALQQGEVSNRSLRYVGRAWCDKAGDPAREQEAATWKASYQSVYGGSDADFAEAMSVYVKDDKDFDAERSAQCDPLKATDEASAEQRLGLMIQRYLFQCDDSLDGAVGWALDRAEISEVERVAVVSLCLGRDDGDQVDPAFAFCLKDMQALDRGRLDGEMKAMKLGRFGRVALRERFESTKIRAGKRLVKYAELAKSDPDWKRLIFDATEAGHAGWMALYNANKDIFAAIGAFKKQVQIGSKKALAGCGEPLRTLFLGYLAKNKVTNAEEFPKLAGDPVAYPLLVSLLQCDAAEGQLHEVQAAYNYFIGAVQRAPRGPRTAAYYAALTTLNDIRADRERFPLEGLGYVPGSPRTAYEAYEETFNNVNADNAEGQIEAVKDNGDGTQTVSFSAVKWKEPVYKCKRTNRISRIDDNGNLIYEENCKQTGTETRSSKESPVIVKSVYVNGLKKGQMAHFSVDTKSGVRNGIPLAVYADKDKKQFVGAFGVIY